MKAQIRQYSEPGPRALFIGCVLIAGMACGSGVAAAQAKPAMSPATPGIHELDLGVAATGQFTTSITNQTYATNGMLLPNQATTTSAGAMATLRDHPVRFVTLEFNYQYTHFSERFFVPGFAAPVYVPTSLHEFTGAYVFRFNRRSVSPYVALGGGYLAFQPPAQFHHQLRGTYLLDMGLDLHTPTRITFRIGAHGLTYRAPDFAIGQLSSSRWVATTEPYIGAHYTF